MSTSPQSILLPPAFASRARRLGIGTVLDDLSVACTVAEADAIIRPEASAQPSSPPSPPAPRRRRVVAAPRPLDDAVHVGPDGRWAVQTAHVDVSEWTMSTHVAAAVMNTTVERVQSLASAGIIPAIKRGRRWYFQPEAIQRIVSTGWGWVPWRANEPGLRLTTIRTRGGVTLRAAVEG